MSEQELTERLINGIIARLQNEINEWSNNVRLRAEAELLDSVKAVLDKYSSTLENIDKELNMEREYRLYDEMMKEKREKLSILEEAYAEVVNRIRDRIKSMRGTDDYKKYLKNSMLWALSIIGSQDVVITTSESDVGIIRELVSELGLSATINTTSEELLGVIVSSQDGSVRVDATLDSRLKLMEHQIKTLLAHLALSG
ncbi:V-type ATP synthase subunit E [Vulcanisaeta sp. JCM 16161]|uniref:V-type ATP synthase subunit E n=1 Tax=Vulcanisaeta sp. JCM 16161 TaxID=1295372 RepID=UPI0006CFFB51|nr:V-type ATP synthase subunit E [Vulcanisaeta sp. JCM 16161]